MLEFVFYHDINFETEPEIVIISKLKDRLNSVVSMLGLLIDSDVNNRKIVPCAENQVAFNPIVLGEI